MKKKPKAALMAIGFYIALNVFIFGGAYLLRRLFSSSVGHWLEIDRPTKPYVPGSFIVMQIFPLLFSYYFYRDRVNRD